MTQRLETLARIFSGILFIGFTALVSSAMFFILALLGKLPVTVPVTALVVAVVAFIVGYVACIKLENRR